jgi:hypothetical protein
MSAAGVECPRLRVVAVAGLKMGAAAFRSPKAGEDLRERAFYGMA